MEDLFLNAASDLDKILDEFEQREAPSSKQEKKKPLTNKKKHLSAVHSSLSNENVISNNVLSKSKPLEISNSLDTPSDISTLQKPVASKTNFVNDNVDMLIDFSSPVIETASSNTETLPVQKNTLQDLDFLLTLLPQEEFKNPSKTDKDDNSSDIKLSSDTNSNENDISSHDDASQKVSQDLQIQLNPNPPKAEAVVGFNTDMQVDESEFNHFMQEPSGSNSTLQKKEVTSDQKINGLNLDKENGEINHANENCNMSKVTTLHPSNEVPSETEVSNEIVIKSKPKLKKVFHRNVAPMPSSASHFHNVDDSNEAIENSVSRKENDAPSSSTTNLQSSTSDTDVNKQHQQNSCSAQNKLAIIKQQQQNKSPEVPDISPPSYSSVIAGEYSAGTVVQRSQPVPGQAPAPAENIVQNNQAESSSLVAREPIEHAIEATESTGNAHVENSTVAPNPPLNPPNPNIPRPGQQKPYWVPDEDCSACTKCQAKFKFTKRRHHCRACGKIFCNSCCNERMPLPYLSYTEARVCLICFGLIQQADALSLQPLQHAPTQPIAAAAPVSVLRTENNPNSLPKSVRFSDGTKPYHPSVVPSTPPPPPIRIPRSRLNRSGETSSTSNFPSLVQEFKSDGSLSVEENPDLALVLAMLRSNITEPITFALSANLFIVVKLVQYCSKTCYYFLSSGLDFVGQSEVAMLLEVKPCEESFPIQVFTLYTHLFNTARKGRTFQANDFLQVEEISKQSGYSIGSTEYAGFIFVHRTVQNMDGLNIDYTDERSMLFSPTVQFSSALFVLMVHKSEVAWTKLFYSRFLLGLGAKYKQYPYPLVNYLDRAPVYTEIANTILGILCDFRNYKYRVVSVPGLSVLIGQNGVSLNIPCNRFPDIVRILNSSNEHVVALGSDTFLTADDTRSHLVTIQASSNRVYNSSVLSNVDLKADENYHVGAAFIVLNGSLKSGTLQQAKCTIVEDGVMIQLLPEKMASLKESLKAMEDFRISCSSSFSKSVADDSSGSLSPVSTGNVDSANHFLEIRWVADDTNFNVGVSSPVDFCSFEGINGYNVQGKSEKKQKNQVLRWNQVFFFKSTSDILDMSRLAERVANGCFQALLPHVQLLRDSSQTKIGVRVNIHPDDVGYSVGSQGLPLPDPCLNALDDELIQLTHEASSSLQSEDEPVVFELIFSILDIRPSWKKKTVK